MLWVTWGEAQRGAGTVPLKFSLAWNDSIRLKLASSKQARCITLSLRPSCIIIIIIIFISGYQKGHKSHRTGHHKTAKKENCKNQKNTKKKCFKIFKNIKKMQLGLNKTFTTT